MIVNRQNSLKWPPIVAFVCAMLAFAAQIGVAKSAGVPSCFANPPSIAADGSYSVSQASGACGELGKILQATTQKDVAWIPGAGLNAILGLSEGGFAPNSYALQFRVSQRFDELFAGQDELVRFAADETRACGGSWWTTLQSVTSANGRFVNATDLEARLALPQSSVPSVVAYSNGVAVGTLGYFGIVAPAFGRSGGAVQFWFPSEPVFTKEFRSLPSP